MRGVKGRGQGAARKSKVAKKRIGELNSLKKIRSGELVKNKDFMIYQCCFYSSGLRRVKKTPANFFKNVALTKFLKPSIA